VFSIQLTQHLICNTGRTVATRVPGMQMKILAAAPGSALAACALTSIVANVKSRRVPGAADGLSLTGPRLLADCYAECTSAGKCTREGEQPATEHPWGDGGVGNGGRARRGPRRPSRVVNESALPTSVAITYRDTRHAAWPYTGMLGSSEGRDVLLAYVCPFYHFLVLLWAFFFTPE
jgi:hypothetical protein